MSNMNKGKALLSYKIFDYLNIITMFIFMLTIILPFVYIILISLLNESNINYMFNANSRISFIAYKAIFTQSNELPKGFIVSIQRTIIGTFFNLVFTCLMAYPLSKKYLPGRSGITVYLVITMLFSGGLIPSYLLITSLKLTDSFWVYILPGLISAWYVILLRNFFQSIPNSLEESAKLDGASDFLILFKIILPLSLPAIATFALFYSVSHWNAWFDAVLYIRTPQKYPLQMVLRRVMMEASEIEQLIMSYDPSKRQTPEAIKSAVLITTITPIVMCYPFLQKYFVKGLMVGSIKG